MLLVMNHRNDQLTTYYTEEFNRKDSQTFVLNSWTNNIERKNFNEENENLYVQLINLNTSPIEITFSISSRPQSNPGIRTNTFSTISKVLMGLLISIVGLIVIFAIATALISSS
jgi:hypothetical protein